MEGDDGNDDIAGVPELVLEQVKQRRYEPVAWARTR
jgi:hypothetical protein